MIKGWTDSTKHDEFKATRLRSDQLWTLLRVARRQESTSWDSHDYFFKFFGTIQPGSDRVLVRAYQMVMEDLVKGLIAMGMVEGSTNTFSPTKEGWAITKKAFDEKYKLATRRGGRV